MAAPGIELRWGSGFQNKHERDKMRETLKVATEFAAHGLEKFGISITDSKRLVVHRVPPGESSVFGSATTSKTMHLFLKEKDIARSQRVNDLLRTCTIFHELVHCQRFEFAPLDNMLERAATEGLAYNAEYLFRSDLAPWYRWPGVVRKIGAMATDEIEPIRGSFIEAATKLGSWDDEEAYDNWMGAAYRHRISKGEIVGIHAVSRQLQAGRTIAELLILPATAILNVM